AKQLLLGVGEWLKVNGEAIYGTRHWVTYGEGETEVVEGPMTERRGKPFGAGDIRFTQKGNNLYAICLAWPGKEVKIKSLGSKSAITGSMISEITMLGSDEALSWSQDETGLKVKTPHKKPCSHAYTFRIVLKESQ
ncbi:MAG: alpha-L-fucosidase, partial [Candidatus Bathyarchaeota archaeon]|nr:alpha-L-fucosidase [Candidatus Bathyarchaeota archaeon]